MRCRIYAHHSSERTHGTREVQATEDVRLEQVSGQAEHDALGLTARLVLPGLTKMNCEHDSSLDFGLGEFTDRTASCGWLVDTERRL